MFGVQVYTCMCVCVYDYFLHVCIGFYSGFLLITVFHLSNSPDSLSLYVWPWDVFS